MFGKKKGEDYYKTHMTEEEIAEATVRMEQKKADKAARPKKSMNGDALTWRRMLLRRLFAWRPAMWMSRRP